MSGGTFWDKVCKNRDLEKFKMSEKVKSTKERATAPTIHIAATSTMAPSKTGIAAKPKPYDRPAQMDKGKAKASSRDLPASVSGAVNIGAPSSKQSSRKGKKALRKNIDITAEERALEQTREEERVTGSARDFTLPSP